MVINESQFDEKLHVRVEASSSKTAEKPKTGEGVGDNGDNGDNTQTLTVSSLKKLGVSELKELPEYEALPDEVKEAADNKGKIIKAILGK